MKRADILDLAVFINDKCNLTCSYCAIPRTGAELSLSKLEELLKGRCYRYGVLLGGEPMMTTHFADAMKLMSKYCEDVKIQTNGSFLRPIDVDFLFDNNLILGLSIDGNTSVKSMQGLKALFMAKQYKPGLRVSVNSMLSDLAIKMFKFLDQYVDEINVGLPVISPGDFLKTKKGFTSSISGVTIVKYENLYYKNPVKYFVHPDVVAAYKFSLKKGTLWKCSQTYGDVIFPDGHMSSCCMWKGPKSSCKGCLSLCDMELTRRIDGTNRV